MTTSEIVSSFQIRRLSKDEKIDSFNCGDDAFILDFIKSYFVIDNKTGCRFITVDAYLNAVPFYLKNGFLPLSQDSDSDYTKLLFFDLDEIEEHDH